MVPLLVDQHAPVVPGRQLLFAEHAEPPFWRTITLFNPLVYLISAFRWAFFGIADVADRA